MAGLFVGLILVIVALADPSRRRSAGVGALTLLLTGAGMALLFPGTGTMPFHWLDAVPAGLSALAVLILCPDRLVRWTAAITLLGLPLFLLIPGAVGANITRLAWVAAAPVIIACAPGRRLVVGVVAGALAIWPLGDLTGQLRAGAGSAAQAAYYQPLQAEVAREQANAGATSVGQRIEVVDTAGHWESAYLSSMSLARGWDRQADYAYNPIFYDDDALTAVNYQSWLTSLAVGWVALPATALDYASVDEGRLIRGGLDYLQLTWSSSHWRLYRVVDSAPLVVGAQVLSVDSTGVVLNTTTASRITTRIRWSPYLATSDPVTGAPISTCVADVNGWVDLLVPRAETVKLTGHFDASVRLDPGNGSCSDLAASGRPAGG